MDFDVTLKAAPALVCNSCQYPLDQASKVGSKVLCPRCNSWSEVASDCSGSCLSCHSHNSQASPVSGCGSSLANSKEKKGIFGAFRELLRMVLVVFKRS